MIRPLPPPHLFAALDVAFEAGTRLSQQHIDEVAAWLEMMIAYNVDDHIRLSVHEVLLISTALNDAISAPMSTIPEKTA